MAKYGRMVCVKISNFLSFSRCFASTEIIRLIRDGRLWGKRETVYLSLNVTTRMTPALRSAAMRAILMFY